MAKPDDRSDNVEKIAESVKNTIGNLREAEDYLSEHADEISEQEGREIKSKNERRRQSIESNREEIKDEASDC